MFKVDNRGRFIIPKIEFYITNVCNLTCARCNRFNDHDFRGWQNWKTYADTYSKWAEKVSLEQVVILGGEPLLNPSLKEWVVGINQLWGVTVQVLSNATRINNTKGLYEILSGSLSSIDAVKSLADNFVGKNFLGVSWHNPDNLKELDELIYGFLKHPVKKIPGNQQTKFPGADFVYEDCNQVRIPIWMQDKFGASAVIKRPNGSFTVHDSDPVRAHGSCAFAQNKNYHFIHGKLYKCGPAALLPEFDNQYQLDISDDDRKILHGYKPLDIEDFDNCGQEFLSTIDDIIPQCKFCPVGTDIQQIYATRKRSKTIPIVDV